VAVPTDYLFSRISRYPFRLAVEVKDPSLLIMSDYALHEVIENTFEVALSARSLSREISIGPSPARTGTDGAEGNILWRGKEQKENPPCGREVGPI